MTLELWLYWIAAIVIVLAFCRWIVGPDYPDHSKDIDKVFDITRRRWGSW